MLTAHYDSLFSAGMLDMASGVVGMLDVALAMKNTPTQNKVRFGFFGGEEFGLLGSQYYVANLTSADKNRIGFILDPTAIATKNFIVQVGDITRNNPGNLLPPSAVSASLKGISLLRQYFASLNIPTVGGPSTPVSPSRTNCGTDGCGIASALGLPVSYIYRGLS